LEDQYGRGLESASLHNLKYSASVEVRCFQEALLVGEIEDEVVGDSGCLVVEIAKGKADAGDCWTLSEDTKVIGLNGEMFESFVRQVKGLLDDVLPVPDDVVPPVDVEERDKGITGVGVLPFFEGFEERGSVFCIKDERREFFVADSPCVVLPGRRFGVGGRGRAWR